MHWIEQVLHLDPDGGSGAVEVALAAVSAVTFAAGTARRAWKGHTMASPGGTPQRTHSGGASPETPHSPAGSA